MNTFLFKRIWYDLFEVRNGWTVFRIGDALIWIEGQYGVTPRVNTLYR